MHFDKSDAEFWIPSVRAWIIASPGRDWCHQTRLTSLDTIDETLFGRFQLVRGTRLGARHVELLVMKKKLQTVPSVLS